jgi:glycosyltransferase involved in cell wall biosynthesis
MAPGPLIVLDRYNGPTAGTERQLFELIEGLRARGQTPGFLLLHRSPWLEERYPDAPRFTVGSARLKSPRMWLRARQGAAWARKRGFRVAHIFLNDCALIFPGLLTGQGLAVVQARRDLGFWYTPTRLRMLRVNRRWTDAIVANSRAVADTVREAECYAPEALHVIHNGLRLPEQVPETAVELRRSLGLADGDRLVVMVANLRPLKRPGDLLRAVAALESRPDRTVHVAFVGADIKRDGVSVSDRLRRLAAELGIADRVHLTGLVETPAAYVAAADVCVLCSETEGLSNAVLEYMHAGKPIVCTSVGGNLELVTDGETGYLVAVGDVAAITDRLARVLDNPDAAARLGVAARARALADFSVEAMVARHEELYASFAR